ncbi:D-2-hydroxyacid dehydrogenase family protein [Chitinimonas sp.]|uniref:D-2-hydroxyacid dehydrogenase family protein n=1 Tax=Chitinimonas sp. TaxID=1934313 RepID=UPI002F945009
MHILIPDDYQYASRQLREVALLADHELTVLGDLAHEPAADATLARTECLVLIRERTVVDAAFLRRTPRLRLISQTGKVARNIDLAACTAAGVAVVEGAGSPTAPAELAWLLIMAARRQLIGAIDGLRQGRWQTNIGSAVHGQTLGILGYGKIGQLLAGYGKAFGMRVLVWGSERALAAAQADGYQAALSRQAFFADSDVLTVHLRLAASTEHSITADDLAAMKPDALFVNTSRAELVAPGALETALAQGRPGYAALDVFEQEPIYNPEHPLLKHPKVLCTPHLGYVERESYALYFRLAFENVLRFAAGERAHVLNPAALPAT